MAGELSLNLGSHKFLLHFSTSERRNIMQMNPYLYFDGDCEAAFKFYEKVLGAKIVVLMTHEGTPMAKHVPAEWQTKVLHGRLTIGDQVLMASDAPPGSYQKQGGFSLSLGFTDAAEAERVFHALAENGTETMPIAETFWAVRFGMLVDRFGIPWMINCEKAAQKAA
ncbi:MAG: VOC family protein [Candidatus Sulfotelmatobacter sp.]